MCDEKVTPVSGSWTDNVKTSLLTTLYFDGSWWIGHRLWKDTYTCYKSNFLGRWQACHQVVMGVSACILARTGTSLRSDSSAPLLCWRRVSKSKMV